MGSRKRTHGGMQGGRRLRPTPTASSLKHAWLCPRTRSTLQHPLRQCHTIRLGLCRFELIPLEELGRPRVDVLCNMSGIFRSG